MSGLGNQRARECFRQDSPDSQPSELFIINSPETLTPSDAFLERGYGRTPIHSISPRCLVVVHPGVTALLVNRPSSQGVDLSSVLQQFTRTSIK
ncbi:hypothetical protein AVEN_241256-1 [Araneus ventricosus]|uniref:Uncharacterized protein n=1 Tax=Araneus ventricosus TaxID=182803 RepID=A0A4Y2PCQ5_ARAVE|nr:hypothetical protein AVEN_241256-1 [Araneus ventricosus]